MTSNAAAPPSRERAIGELIFAASLWGFGFIASQWALTSFHPIWIAGIRFAVAFALGLPALLFVARVRAACDREQLRLPILAGLMIGLTLLLQLWGLKYTTVTRSSFITSLYIVFVPILEQLWFGRRLGGTYFAWVFVALLGAGLMCQVEGGNWNRGDLITLACAFTSAVHILILEIAGPRIRSAFVFNTWQCFWAGLLPLVLIPLFPRPVMPVATTAWFGIAFLAIAVQFVAFLIQVRGQKVIPPSIISMLFLIESPFAAFFAYLIFGETLTLWQALGAGLILLSAVGTLKVVHAGHGHP